MTRRVSKAGATARLLARAAACGRLAAVAAAMPCVLAASVPAQAGLFRPATGRWCAEMTIGLNDCSYASYEQCMATLSGIGGICSVNLQAPPPEPPPRRKRRKARPIG
jgi:hypothetical protein